MERQNNTEKTLSMRERQVLQLTSYGFSQKEAADQLQISRNTIDVHLKNIKNKTGLQKNTELELAYVFSTYHIPVTDLPATLRTRISFAFTALGFERLLRVNRANRSSETNPARKTKSFNPNFEKITMALFAALFALGSVACIVGACIGYPWHIYTAVCAAAISAICISEYKKI